MKCERKEILTCTLYVSLLIVAFTNLGIVNINQTFAANTNSEEVEKILIQTENCNAASICDNVIVIQVQNALADVLDIGSNSFNDVSDSAEVEQEAEQELDCDTSFCQNAIIVQAQQLAQAIVSNIDTVQEDSINSAEVEQIAEQENEDYVTATCQNGHFGQTQQAAAAVTNLGGNYKDVSNSAEIEQIAEQENKDCKKESLCINVIGDPEQEFTG